MPSEINDSEDEKSYQKDWCQIQSLLNSSEDDTATQTNREISQHLS